MSVVKSDWCMASEPLRTVRYDGRVLGRSDSQAVNGQAGFASEDGAAGAASSTSATSAR